MSIILVLFSVHFLFFAIKASSSANLRTLIPEQLELNSVRDALVEKQGWPLQRAEAARAEHVRFLTLLQRKPGFTLIPWRTEEGHDDLDQFWRQHILDTAKYAADCNALFGRIIHHNPHVARGSEDERDAEKKTQRLYARTFGSGSYGRSVNSADLAGCGACAAVNSIAPRTEGMDTEITDMAGTVVMEGMAAEATVVVDTVAAATAVAAVAVAIDRVDRRPHLRSWAGRSSAPGCLLQA